MIDSDQKRRLAEIEAEDDGHKWTPDEVAAMKTKMRWVEPLEARARHQETTNADD